MCVGSPAKGIHIWRFLHTMNQYAAMLYNMCMPLHNKIQCVGILHKENQYVEAPPQKELVCGGPSMKKESICGGPLTNGKQCIYRYTYIWRLLHKESMCGNPPQKGANMCRPLPNRNHYVGIPHKGNPCVEAPPQKESTFSNPPQNESV